MTIPNMSVIWFNENTPQLQRHHARKKWSCLFREHFLQWFHKIFKTMIYPFAQDKCENVEYEYYLV